MIEEPAIAAHVVALEPGHPYLRLPLQFATGIGDEDTYRDQNAPYEYESL